MHQRVDSDWVEIEQKAPFVEQRDARVGDDARLGRQKQRLAGLANDHPTQLLREQVLEEFFGVCSLHQHKPTRGFDHTDCGTECLELFGGRGQWSHR